MINDDSHNILLSFRVGWMSPGEKMSAHCQLKPESGGGYTVYTRLDTRVCLEMECRAIS